MLIDINKSANLTVVLYQTSSSKLSLIIEDMVKTKVRADVSATKTIESNADVKELWDIMNVYPSFADRWLIRCDMSGKKKHLSKEMLNVIQKSSTLTFLIKVTSYSSFKTIKESLSKVDGVVSLYMQRLTRADYGFLYSRYSTIKGSTQLTADQLNFTFSSYNDNIESVLSLFESLSEGVEYTGRGEIIKKCGIAQNSVESFVMSLCKPLKGLDGNVLNKNGEPIDFARSQKTTLNHRLTAGRELLLTMTPSGFYNSMKKCIGNFMLIKELKISAKINTQIEQLPDAYDEQTLHRYQKYMYWLKETKTSTLVNLYMHLGKKKWESEADFIAFIYGLYNDQVKELQTIVLQKVGIMK